MKRHFLRLPVFLAVDHQTGLHAGFSLPIDAPEHIIFFYGHGSFHGFSFTSQKRKYQQGRQFSLPPSLAYLSLFGVHFPPSSVGQAGTTLGAATGENLAAVAGGHSLAEAVYLGALALLGLIGTEHCMTPPS